MILKSSALQLFGLIALLLGFQGYTQEEHGHHNRANQHMNQADFESLTRSFESSRRDSYQQPEKVLEYIGDVAGETIMDIGSGTGYFSFRLVEAGAKVIAADVDERFQEYIRIKKDRLGIPDSKLSLRIIPYDDPLLEPGEVDKVITVNTYHHIEDRSIYFGKVRSGLKPGGVLIVIDYFKKDLPVGPPKSMKIDRETIVSELRAAGFINIETNDTLLEYQFIITAR
ncbi:MAG: class I SAM-dependent methyltransferase [Bacteroidetes bacterium]|nr:MAG: class I SAM-dependent methyltransferase [Bacteroidota bacterium]UCE68504.1 MAG: class I SAM-dependent methyltransferase [Flavobacteriaceae bacterium]